MYWCVRGFVCTCLEPAFYARWWSILSLDTCANDVIPHHQHGFQTGLSCQTQLVETVHDWASSMKNKKQTDILLLDFYKAFDTVPHKRLLNKLNYYGITGPTLQWINSFLSNRTQTVSVNGYHSSPANVISGVPQGSVLGPVLFLLYINDITDSINSNIRLFADDSILYR